MEERAAFLINYAVEHGPVTVRGLYYQAEVHGVPGIDKTDSSYDKIQRQVLNLRREGRLDYNDIADSTRWMRKPVTHDSVEDALNETARTYRKSLWRDNDARVAIWAEKDAVAAVLFEITSKYDVGLMVARRFSSETFCFEAVEQYMRTRSLTFTIWATSTDWDATRPEHWRRSSSALPPRRASRSCSSQLGSLLPR
jgi:hypothetical protein